MTELRHTLPQPIFSSPTHLEAQQAHLWLLDLRRFGEAYQSAATSVMSAAELAKAQRFKRGKESYIASRWLLRTCLARYTGTSAPTIEFARTAQGKPYLPGSNIHFSLSHSGPWALLAIAPTPLIGVDIEANRRARDLLSIAQHYYHPEESAQLNSLNAEQQDDYFYRLWTLKEAFFKAIGTGISAGLDKVHFSLTNNGDNQDPSQDPSQNHPPIRAIIHPQLANADALWQFRQWQLPEGDLIALAYAATEPSQTIWFDALAAPAFP